MLSLRQRVENLSCLFPSSCFSFYFVLLPWIPLLPCICFPSHFFCHHPSLSSLTCLSECQYIFLPSFCTLLPHYPFTACHSVTLLHLLDSFSFSFPLPRQFHHSPSFPSVFLSPPLTVNVCDEEMLLCQNGGTCYQNQKCICPPEFKGVLCQESRCEAGKDCNAASSLHLSTATLLLCTLLAHLLATLTPHWATKKPLRPRSVCLCVCSWGNGWPSVGRATPVLDLT